MSYNSEKDAGLPFVDKPIGLGLRSLAQRNGRTQRGQLEFLIKQACAAQGIRIDLLKPEVNKK